MTSHILRDVHVTVPLDAYLSLKALRDYSTLSQRTLREAINAQRDPLPHYRVGGRVLVRRSEFDAWMGDPAAPGQRALAACARGGQGWSTRRERNHCATGRRGCGERTL